MQDDPKSEQPSGEIPDDLLESLKIISGHRPDSFREEFEPNTATYPKFNGAGFMGVSARDEFIKKKDPVEKKLKCTENKTYVLDLTKEDDNKKYSELLDKIGDPESGYVLADALKDPQIFIDPSSIAGFRAIAIIKIFKPVIYLKSKFMDVDDKQNKANEE
jgi:hypothetical protein